MSQSCLTCQLDLGLFTESDVYYHHLRHHKDHLEPAPPPGIYVQLYIYNHLQHHKDHLEPAPPPGALRCPLRPQYDKKGGKIRWTTEFFFPKNHFLFDENDF